MGLDDFFETTYKTFQVEFISQTFCVDGQCLKGYNAVLYYAYLSELGKMTQKIRFTVKVVTNGFWEHLPSNFPRIAVLMPLPPFPSLLVQVKASHT